MTTSLPKRAPGRATGSTKSTHDLFQGSRLRAELYASLRESELPTKAIAAALGISESYLVRCCLSGPSATRFPVDLLTPFMAQTGSFRVLEHLCQEAKHVAVPLRRVRQIRKLPVETLNEMASEFHALLGALFEFVQRPVSGSATGLRARLRRHMADMAALSLAIESNLAQLDLELGPELERTA